VIIIPYELFISALLLRRSFDLEVNFTDVIDTAPCGKRKIIFKSSKVKRELSPAHLVEVLFFPICCNVLSPKVFKISCADQK